MTRRSISGLAVCALALGCFGGLSRAHGQDPPQTPFTIRRLTDNTTVREKVKIQIPRESIGKDSYVVFFLDDKFHLALSPDPNEEENSQFFTFIWDTKGSGVSDGPHSIRAVLYAT